MARRFGQADISRYDGFEHELPEDFPHVVRHLIGQAIPAIEHGQRDPDDSQVGVEPLLHPLDRLQELAEPLQREELALERNQERIRRAKGVQGQETVDGGQSIKQMS